VRPSRQLALVLTLACVLIAPLSAQRFAGRVLDVTDGDTVIVARGNSSEPLGFSPAVVRLFGIDAPEAVQPYGREAAAELSRLVMGKVIDVGMKDIDQYGRLVAEVSVGGTDVGRLRVSSHAVFEQRASGRRRARGAAGPAWAVPVRVTAAALDVPCRGAATDDAGPAGRRRRVSRQPRVTGVPRARLSARQLQELHRAVCHRRPGEGGRVQAA